jgi:hypothetical protein
VLIEAVAPHFKPECRVTLIVRNPENDQSDVMLSTDTPEGIRAALDRSLARPDVQDAIRNSERPQ